MAGRVEGKVVIVTGGGTGIGRGIVELLGHEGARVVVANRSMETGEQSAAAVRQAGGQAICCPTDVSREADCARLIDRTLSEYGGLHGLVNNAGIFPRATLEETNEDLWDRIMAVNLKGAFFCCKHAVPAMREAGGASF